MRDDFQATNHVLNSRHGLQKGQPKRVRESDTFHFSFCTCSYCKIGIWNSRTNQPYSESFWVNSKMICVRPHWLVCRYFLRRLRCLILLVCDDVLRWLLKAIKGCINKSDKSFTLLVLLQPFVVTQLPPAVANGKLMLERPTMEGERLMIVMNKRLSNEC